MGEEMRGVEADTEWRKAIPEGRDRLQSQVLVGVVGSLLVMATISVLGGVYSLSGTDGEGRMLQIFGISAAFSCLVLALRGATAAGALCGGLICLILLHGTFSWQFTLLRSGLAPLALLFVLTFLSTHAGRRFKVRAGLAEGRQGRSSAQVIANLGVAGLSVSSLGFAFVMEAGVYRGESYYKTWVFPAMMIMCLSALVEATADTVSSEIGQAFGGRPVMLLTMQSVAPGTDGAVTLLGSLAGGTGGAFVAAVGMWALRLRPSQAAIALLAGICGLFFDSLLGATLERRGWLGNDLVNFSSTMFAAGIGVAGFWLFVR